MASAKIIESIHLKPIASKLFEILITRPLSNNIIHVKIHLRVYGVNSYRRDNAPEIKKNMSMVLNVGLLIGLITGDSVGRISSSILAPHTNINIITSMGTAREGLH